jgi:transcriptional regulator with XRE-family HTH domain
MDRKSFGKLLAVLRQEMNWTQAEFAELADVDTAVISNLERGIKRNIEPELLFKLANALRLTTIERREFILAASGLEESHIVRQPDGVSKTNTFDAGKVLRQLDGIVGSLRIPAFLVDVYSDVLSANLIILRLLQVSPDVIAQAPYVPGGYTTLRVTYGEMMRLAIPSDFEEFVMTSMRSFREVSLRYRAQPYFQYLMKEFRNPKKYPWFEHTWRKVVAMDDDKFATIDPFSYAHAVYGQLTYYVSSSVSFTPYGELFLCQYLPVDAHTAAVFEQLAVSEGTSSSLFAPWPEKKMV